MCIRDRIQGEDPLLRVHVRGSTSAGTGTIEVWGATTTAGTLDTIVGSQDFTLGTDNRASGGYQPRAPLYFDVSGFYAYDVRCVTLSAGTLDVKATTVGAGSVAAE